MGENGAAVMESVTQSGLIGMQMGLAGMQQQHIMAAMLAAQVPGVSNSSGLGGVAPMPGMQVAGRKQRELYVGNLTPGVCTPDLVKQFFTQILTTCDGYSPTMGPPCACVQLSGEGKFAFVEFTSEMMAVTALQLDKVELAGRALNVGRPAGFIPPPPGMPLPTPLKIPPGAAPGLPGGSAVMGAMPSESLAALAQLPGAVVGQANKKQRELYVGNLPVGMVTPSALRDLFSQPLKTMPNFSEAAGQPVLNVDIAPDGKFAFVEFRDEEITQIALTLFDKMELCGRTLNVGRPRGYVEPGGGLGSTLLPQLGGGFGALGASAPPPPPPAPPAAPAEPPTKCLKLEGLIMPDMLTEAEYPEVYDDIKTECAQSGAVAQLRIPRTGEPQAGLCFVTYQTLSGAAKAKEALHKRQFDGNTVLATFMPEEPPDEPPAGDADAPPA